ncbi:hypothetical protein [Absidia glauca]|uniref:Uncharacterized protein n=1 Tax=Absidia glauca TaxID=4829 RepID=A0A163JV44_ABSGL|nr:hypothetical protein [Absidia glauca]
MARPENSPPFLLPAKYSTSASGYKDASVARPIILLLLPLVITFLPPLSFSLLHDVKRTDKRANERTNGNSPLLTS